MTTEKECNVCLCIKPLEDFHRTNSRGGKFGRVPSCKVCRLAKIRAQRLADPTRERAIRVASKNRRAYGLEPGEIAAMHDAQGGLCKICGEADTSVRNCLHVDHCHSTGVVRGLLCSHCNLMLGHAKDNAETLIKAAAYLASMQEGS